MGGKRGEREKGDRDRPAGKVAQAPTPSPDEAGDPDDADEALRKVAQKYRPVEFGQPLSRAEV
jgi:hypothetical protein